MFSSVYAFVGAVFQGIVSPRVPSVLRREEGQTTAEYALVILAAAAVAVVLIAWARSSGKLPAFFDDIIDQVAGSAS
jgi:Flp pilus assembly pilin Flp